MASRIRNTWSRHSRLNRVLLRRVACRRVARRYRRVHLLRHLWLHLWGNLLRHLWGNLLRHLLMGCLSVLHWRISRLESRLRLHSLRIVDYYPLTLHRNTLYRYHLNIASSSKPSHLH